MAGERLVPQSVIRLIEDLKPKPPVETLESRLRSAYQKALHGKGRWLVVNEIIDNDPTGEAKKIVNKLDEEFTRGTFQ